MKFKKPYIFSFEFCNNSEYLNRILDIVKNNNIKNISIGNIPNLNFLKKIEADFISIDVDYFELNQGNYKKTKEIDKSAKQIRLLVTDVYNEVVLKGMLQSINKNFNGSKILFFKKDEFIKKDIDKIMKLSKKFGFIPSFLIKESADLKKYFLSKKKQIFEKKLFLDSPKLLGDIMGEKYSCPANGLMCHIDCNYNIKLCKFSNKIIGNLKEDNLLIYWEKSQKFPLKEICTFQSDNNEPYGFLSAYYDELMKDKEVFFNEYRDFIVKTYDKSKRILDCACGTGTLIKKLEEYPIEGLEQSSEMVKIARRKTKKNIYINDLRNFKINKKYDLITCTFDSLNYILREDELVQVFKNIYNHLSDDGDLIFDMNFPGKFKEHFNEKNFVENFEIELISSYKDPFWRLEFKKNETSKEHREVHYERFYPSKLIRKMLLKVGFKKIIIRKYLLNKGQENRNYFIASK